MSEFVNDLISRHTGLSNKITPRLPGIFEPAMPHTQDLPANDVGDFETESPNNPITIHPFQQFERIPLPKEEGKSPGSAVNEARKQQFERQDPDNINDVNEERKLTTENNELYHDQSVYNTAPGENLKKSMGIFLPGTESNMSNRTVEEFSEDGHTDDTQTSNHSSITRGKKNPFTGPLIGNRNKDAASVYPRNIMFDKQSFLGPQRLDFPFDGQASNSTSVIKISIGRIEVRAISSPVIKQSNDAKIQKPRMSLEDYLAKRNNNKS